MDQDHGEPTLADVLSDPVTLAVMAADRVDPQELSATLSKMVGELTSSPDPIEQGKCSAHGTNAKAVIAEGRPDVAAKLPEGMTTRWNSGKLRNSQRSRPARLRGLPPDGPRLFAGFFRACGGRPRHPHVSVADRNRNRHSGIGAADPLFECAVVDLRATLSAPFALGVVAARPWSLHPAASDAPCDQHAGRREPAWRHEPL
jgi:hypothetical protein